MSEIEDRVARAIDQCEMPDGDPFGVVVAMSDYCESNHSVQDICKIVARAAIAAMPVWRTIESGLPTINETVLIVHKSGFDGKPIYAWGARLDGDEGWCWGVGQSYVGIRPDEDAVWNGIECDDEYEVTHWMPLPTPPAPIPQDRETP